ncbi:LacI family DNA-binding transcriptional regulator [Mucilaginibacter paludis]|uniref:Transcriptional regulator, LacI family n=1 Tax=Mucilaginibacter paludis DSM 18603 TaxID=714943 RepID=H1YB58_9SPHI|nr:LacI family DNA-binding transcriptional regulator [Mucilaginibacter paludis]EHQ30584.1 transcriptional regulator, LacI family [Mucilaginibacter paludis DSM 18603]
MFEPVKLKDIAKALNVSVSTVSRSLSGGHEISEKTRNIVLRYAQKLNYRQNPIALSLKERRSRSIGVVISEVANSYFSQAISGIESIAYDRGYHIFITQTHESADREIANVQHLSSRSVDGLLISLASETQEISHLKSLHDKGLPIVFFDRVSPEIETHKVIANNYKGAFEATVHLIKSGFRRIAHITGAHHLSTSKDRLRGYLAALDLYSIPCKPEYIIYCENGGMIQAETDAAIAQLALMPDRPDALFIGGDKLSTGCLSALKKQGLQVPQDIAIAGFTNSDVAELFKPSLTAVSQPAYQIGQKAAEMLIQLIESKKPVTQFETEMFSTELIVRKSTDKV